MKIYITHTNDELPGFTTFSPLRGINVRELDSELVADSELDEAICDCLDYIPLLQIPLSLQNFVKKLRKGGSLTISGIDCYLLSMEASKRNLNLQQLNAIVYGGPHASNMRMSMISVTDACGFLEQLGLKIMKKSLSGVSYTIEGVKS